jgi:uncharacterized protein
MLETAIDRDHPAKDEFIHFVEATQFPCVGAKAALGRGQLSVLVGHDIASGWADLPIVEALHNLADEYAAEPVVFRSLAVLFPNSAAMNEAAFETAMWERLQSLTDKDSWLGHAHDARVSSDPDSPHFSLSFGGQGFFVVGLHPGASRPARRHKVPTLVFNLHDQFEQLRTQGRYEKLRTSILDRDEALAGSINPMLARHGITSEARQYSGRLVDDGWTCPFARAAATDPTIVQMQQQFGDDDRDDGAPS